MKTNQGISEIQSFYKGANIFITGGTGFLGKLLIEKLLRDTDVETIYLLVREKRGKSPHMRIDALFDDVVFDRLKREKPKCRNRIEAISGDCSVAGLGISITDRQLLINKINIVFHVAATVNFTEHIKLAYNINVNGTKSILNLAQEMKELKSIMHVSTAYSNCPRKEIGEKVYDHPVKCSDIELILDKMSEKEADLNTPKLLGEWPNTYSFTKAIAESLIKNTGNGLPIGVFRPAIVISTYKEPIPSWIDNLYGATGIAAGSTSGVLRVTISKSYLIADLVPADTCVAGLIAASWDVAEKVKKIENNDEVPVYNYVSSIENPISWGEFRDLNLGQRPICIPSNALWYPNCISISNIFIYKILVFFLHLIPGFIIDTVSVLSGKRPRLLKMYKTIHKFSEATAYFSLREWKFNNDNVQNLWKKLNKTDQDLFPFSMKTVSWFLYLKNYTNGIKMYIFKEGEDTREYCIKKFERLRIAHYTLKFVSLWLFFSIFSTFLSKIWHFIL